MKNIENNATYSQLRNTNIYGDTRNIDNRDIDLPGLDAIEHGIDISDEHLDVMQFLRDYYVENGWPKRTHILSRMLDKKYKHLGGNKYLRQLFPKGPLTQGAQLAGLPVPANVIDRSFGTAH